MECPLPQRSAVTTQPNIKKPYVFLDNKGGENWVYLKRATVDALYEHFCPSSVATVPAFGVTWDRLIVLLTLDYQVEAARDLDLAPLYDKQTYNNVRCVPATADIFVDRTLRVQKSTYSKVRVSDVAFREHMCRDGTPIQWHEPAIRRYFQACVQQHGSVNKWMAKGQHIPTPELAREHVKAVQAHHNKNQHAIQPPVANYRVKSVACYGSPPTVPEQRQAGLKRPESAKNRDKAAPPSQDDEEEDEEEKKMKKKKKKTVAGVSAYKQTTLLETYVTVDTGVDPDPYDQLRNQSSSVATWLYATMLTVNQACYNTDCLSNGDKDAPSASLGKLIEPVDNYLAPGKNKQGERDDYSTAPKKPSLVGRALILQEETTVASRVYKTVRYSELDKQLEDCVTKCGRSPAWHEVFFHDTAITRIIIDFDMPTAAEQKPFDRANCETLAQRIWLTMFAVLNKSLLRPGRLVQADMAMFRRLARHKLSLRIITVLPVTFAMASIKSVQTVMGQVVRLLKKARCEQTCYLRGRKEKAQYVREMGSNSVWFDKKTGRPSCGAGIEPDLECAVDMNVYAHHKTVRLPYCSKSDDGSAFQPLWTNKGRKSVTFIAHWPLSRCLMGAPYHMGELKQVPGAGMDTPFLSDLCSDAAASLQSDETKSLYQANLLEDVGQERVNKAKEIMAAYYKCTGITLSYTATGIRLTTSRKNKTVCNVCCRIHSEPTQKSWFLTKYSCHMRCFHTQGKVMSVVMSRTGVSFREPVSASVAHCC